MNVHVHHEDFSGEAAAPWRLALVILFSLEENVHTTVYIYRY